MTIVSHVTVHLTRKCNLKCKYCHTDSGMNREEPEIADHVARMVFSGECTPSVSFAGGEPFCVRSDLWRWAEYAKTHGVAKVAVTTNGALMTGDDVAHCRDLDMRVQFSIDGMRNVHERIRGKGTFSKTVSAMESSLSQGLSCDVLVTVSRETMADALTLVRMLDGLGVSNITFLHFSPKGRGADWREQVDFLPGEWEGFVEKLRGVAVRAGVFVQPGFASRADIEAMDARRRINQCNWWKFAFTYIDVREKTAYPCGLCYGSPFSVSFREGDDIQSMKALFEERRSAKFAPKGQCKSCTMEERCQGGARCYALWGTGDMEGCDPRCEKNGVVPICPFVSVKVGGDATASITSV